MRGVELAAPERRCRAKRKYSFTDAVDLGAARLCKTIADNYDVPAL